MTFTWKESEIHYKLSNLIDYVIETAFQDEIISSDEESLIEVIRGEMWNLEKQIKQLVESQISIDGAEQKIKEMFEMVLSQTAQTAKKDGTITADELLIIDRLAKYIRKENFRDYIS